MRARLQTVLWVEDNEAVRDLGRHHLERADFEVFAAEDGLAALEILAEISIDLILLDLRLPDMDGLEVLRQVRRTDSSRQLPVLVVTSSEDSASMVEAFSLGANDYITKPLDWAVLRARMQAQLRLASDRNPAPSRDNSTSLSGVPQIGDFDLEELIGGGSQSKVFRALHLPTGRPVAIKVLPLGTPLPRPFEHPNTAQTLQTGQLEGGQGFIVMELLGGITLEEEIRRHGPCSFDRCREIFGPVCDTLQAAHRQNLTHGDIKPQNIILHQSAGREVVKLIDFGLADDVGPPLGAAALESVTQRATADFRGIDLASRAGTPAYMAPECFADAPCDHRIDIYSLGVTLFESLTGSLPFLIEDGNLVRLAKMHLVETAPTVTSLRQDLPPWVDEVIAPAMAKDPAQRPSVGELAASLLGHNGPHRGAH